MKLDCLVALLLAMTTTAHAAPIKIETYTVQAKPFEQIISLIGTLKAHREALLLAPSSGILTQIFAQEGSQVKKGQVLAEMDIASLRQSLGDTKRNVQIKRDRVKSLKTLQTHGDISLKDLEDAKSDLARAEQELSGAKFRAPFAGECGLFRAEIGAHLGANDPVVAVYDMSSLIVYFSVPENLLGKIKIGQKILVKNEEATVSSLENRLDPKTHQAYAKAILKSCTACVVGAKVSVVISLPEQAMSVPAESVFIQDQKTYVYRVINQKAVLTPVTTGARSNKQIAILDGLSRGDKLILRGQSKIHHDDPVY